MTAVTRPGEAATVASRHVMPKGKTMKSASLMATSAAILLAGCATHLSTSPDRDVTAPGLAVAGTPYSLPMLQYDITLTRSLTACPTLTEFQAGGAPLATGSVGLAVKAEVKPHYIPGESYTVDFSTLASPFRTSAFAIETYESGTLKSINVSGEDKTDEVIKDSVKLGLAVVSLAGGNPGALFGGTNQLALMSTKSAAGIRKSIPLIKKPKTLDEKLADMLGGLPPQPIVVCTKAARDLLEAADTQGAARKAHTTELQARTKRVAALTVVTGAKAAEKSHVDALQKAYEDQADSEAALQAALDAETDATDALSDARTVAWPRAYGDGDGHLDLPLESRDKFNALLVPGTARVLRQKAFNDWFRTDLDPSEQGRIQADPRFKSFFQADGELKPPPTKPAPCENPVSVDACLTAQLDARAWLRRAPTGIPACKPGDPMTAARQDAMRDCARIVPVKQIDERPWTEAPTFKEDPTVGPLGRKARDGVPDKGIFFRTPGAAVLTVCRASAPAAPDDADLDACAKPDRFYVSPPTSAPQFGQLRYLPFQTRTFEANEMAVLLREDGSLQKFEYKRTAASAAKAAAAAADAVSQYKTAVEAQQKAAKDSLDAARAEEVAQVQHQIDLLTKQKELLKLQTPETEDDQKATKEETLRLQTETALLEAKLARLKAEAALAAAS